MEIVWTKLTNEILSSVSEDRIVHQCINANPHEKNTF